MADITFRRATVDDKKELYDLLVAAYFTDMPLYEACNISEAMSIDEWPTLQELANDLSVVAVSVDGKIVGAAINVIPKDGEEVVGLPGPINRFFTKVNEDSKGLVFQLEKTTMELRIMSVARHARGKGISKRLITETEKVALSTGRTSIFAIATGHYMEAAFKRQNWKITYSNLYKNYVDVVPEFKVPAPPHDRFAIFEKKLA